MRRRKVSLGLSLPSLFSAPFFPGKIYPDSFNRTIPIWCAVINAVARSKGQALDCRILPEWMPQTGNRMDREDEMIVAFLLNDSEEFFCRQQLADYISLFRKGKANSLSIYRCRFMWCAAILVAPQKLINLLERNEQYVILQSRLNRNLFAYVLMHR